MSVGKKTNSGEMLRSFVERVEAVRERKKECTADESVIMAEAKANGFVPKVIKACVKARAEKPHDRQEAEALYTTYMHALGMAEEPPLFRQLSTLSADPASRDSVLDALKKLAPAKGDIILRMEGQPVRLYRDKDGEVHADPYSEPSSARPAAPAPAAARQQKEIPECDAAGAEELGRKAARENRPVIDNPFPHGDERRARFDEGWRKESGSDGMGAEDD